jgi:hypothetical protein
MRNGGNLDTHTVAQEFVDASICVLCPTRFDVTTQPGCHAGTSYGGSNVKDIRLALQPAKAFAAQTQ